MPAGGASAAPKLFEPGWRPFGPSHTLPKQRKRPARMRRRALQDGNCRRAREGAPHRTATAGGASENAPPYRTAGGQARSRACLLAAIVV